MAYVRDSNNNPYRNAKGNFIRDNQPLIVVKKNQFGPGLPEKDLINQNQINTFLGNLITQISQPTLLDATSIGVDGNSIIWGYVSGPVPTNGSTINNGIDAKIQNAIKSKLLNAGKSNLIKSYNNVAIPGQRTEEMLGRQAQYAQPTFDSTVSRNVLLVLEGGNSLSGFGWLDRQDTPQQAFDLLKQYCQQEKAVNKTRKIVVFTVLPRYLPNRPYAPDSPFYFETLRLEYNRLVRLAKANNETWIDAVADVAADGLIGTPYAAENPAYYHDGVHQTEAGAQITAEIGANAVMEALFSTQQPVPTPILNIFTAPGSTEETAITRKRNGDWQSFSDDTAASNVTAQYALANTNGEVNSTEIFVGNRADIFGPISENGGRIDVLVDGLKVYSGTTKAAQLLKDQLYYTTGVLANGIYGNQHIVRVIFLDGYGYDDRRQYFN